MQWSADESFSGERSCGAGDASDHAAAVAAYTHQLHFHSIHGQTRPVLSAGGLRHNFRTNRGITGLSV